MRQSDRLANKVYLVVEDEYLIACMLTMALEEAGGRVLGPVSSAEGAIDLLNRAPEPIDAAILDVNLNGPTAFSLADHLMRQGTPFVFATGYDRSVLPERFADVPCFDKPYDHHVVIDALAAL